MTIDEYNNFEFELKNKTTIREYQDGVKVFVFKVTKLNDSLFITADIIAEDIRSDEDFGTDAISFYKMNQKSVVLHTGVIDFSDQVQMSAVVTSVVQHLTHQSSDI